MFSVLFQDVDSYIHRSGRTGRAGRAGVSVLLYNNHTEHELHRVEKHAVSKLGSAILVNGGLWI